MNASTPNDAAETFSKKLILLLVAGTVAFVGAAMIFAP